MGPLFHVFCAPESGQVWVLRVLNYAWLSPCRLCQALPSAPPILWLVFGPSSVPLFLPCPLRVRPLWARCVGVGVFPFFLSSFAFPVSCSGKVLCHLIVTLISCSFSSHSPCCGRVCVSMKLGIQQAAVSLAMPMKLWDSAGWECGRKFLYLQM